jgi:HEPN domain-containing protein
MANTPKGWMMLGDRDYDAAAFLAANMHPKPLEIICFHCQQAVEKYLKGFLVIQDVDPPYTHDLIELGKLCEKYNASFSAIREMCDSITLYGVQPRYDSGRSITEAEASLVLQNVQTIKTFLQKEAPQLFQ